MVESGQVSFLSRPYRNPSRPGLGVEVLRYADLGARLPGRSLTRLHRLDFCQLTLVERGHGSAMVDFVTHDCEPGTLLVTRPGQVQRLPLAADGDREGMGGIIVLFTEDFLPEISQSVQAVVDPVAPSVWQLDGADRAALQRSFSNLRSEYDSAPEAVPEIYAEMLRHLLDALLLRIALLFASSEHVKPNAAPEPYRRLVNELERSFAERHHAREYAAHLGYSLRTLNRACMRATGNTAKQLIDSRIALEAQRLLAHSDLPVAAISRRLGFTEATNFNKFFSRATGQTPGAFRGQH